MTKMKLMSALTAAVVFLAGCAPPHSRAVHPAEAVGVGVGYVAVSPILILKGLAEGIAATPYFLEADTREMNQVMVRSGARVDLDRTYRYAYGAGLEQSLAERGRGRVFREMRSATQHFQKVLRGYGVRNAREFHLTAVRSADQYGYTLYAVVYRPAGRINVQAATGEAVTLTKRNTGFYRPYELDARGRPLDLVLDWAAVPRTAIGTQKGQALLMTIAANSVLINRRSDEFWDAARRWRAGEFREITAGRRTAMAGRLQ